MIAPLVLTLLVGVGAVSSANTGIRDSYKTWCVGQCTVDVKTTTTPGAVLMGGGTDTNEAFEWHIGHANGGDFLVMRASGDDAYNDYIYDMSIASGQRLNSVTTILFKNEKASEEEEVLKLISNAEAIFFAGGDQNEYLNYWAGTKVQNIIQEKVVNITVGGTSAGLAVLGNWVYSAEEGSVYSDEAMEDPYNKYMTIADSFLKVPYLDTIISDTHFVTRNRMGRMLSFVARILQDDKTINLARGVGVDEHTALLLDVTTGDVQTVGVGTAYVCTATHDPEVCQPGVPLTFHGIQCVRLSGATQDAYSFATFTTGGGAGVTYENDITAGKFTTLPYGPPSATSS
mmetsp:Transcript_10533/g.17712  ORF Transcript_10533/g.17712 Transcript_10533/m.17712 type:complete len:344 (+) Transcript_10533:23-1054(+)